MNISFYIIFCTPYGYLRLMRGWFKYCKSSISGKKRHSTMCGIACPPPARVKKGVPLFCQVACNCRHSTVFTLGWRLELEPTNLSESNIPCQANIVADLLHQVQPAEATFLGKMQGLYRTAWNYYTRRLSTIHDNGLEWVRLCMLLHRCSHGHQRVRTCTCKRCVRKTLRRDYKSLGLCPQGLKLA